MHRLAIAAALLATSCSSAPGRSPAPGTPTEVAAARGHAEHAPADADGLAAGSELVASFPHGDGAWSRSALELLDAAGIHPSRLERAGAVSIAVPGGRAADARRLLHMLPGGIDVAAGAPLPDADFLLLAAAEPPPPLRELPTPDAPWTNIAFCSDFDSVSQERIWRTLDARHIPAIGISNAGGMTCNVPEPFAEEARAALRATRGAQPGGPRRAVAIGSFTVAGDAAPGSSDRDDGDDRADAPAKQPDDARAFVAAFSLRDYATSYMVGAALVIADLDAAGSAEDTGDAVYIVRLTVPEAERARAVRLLLALPGAERGADAADDPPRPVPDGVVRVFVK